ncbi:hypothetical protein [Jatrophihabitans sp. GAS493]|uniref:hypothetical protein n=1 Tax=Jatrophihabitans sp. GAS493 TaxID=1907575 RepID=UPI000BB8F943|nr:hypothetical protein [Jatrophihabitans sp. GAS493]
MMTVVVLAVLWLIVVVPMVLRRKDERARERSVASFGQAMRALTRAPVTARAALAARKPAAGASDDAEAASYVLPRTGRARSEVFVAGARRTMRRSVTADGASEEGLATRRPVPAAEEALMYPVDRSEMSAARTQMMSRRRRSLTILGVGTAVSLLLGFFLGGLTWILTVAFVGGLSGYLWFLRSQALNDRDRRAARQQRALLRQEHGYEAHDAVHESRDSAGPEFAPIPDSVVRIDDDDLALHNMDTVDLTGLYSADGYSDPQLHRRAG